MTEQLTEQGLKDGLSELAKIRLLLRSRLREAEARATTAEQDAADLRKMVAFADVMASDYGGRLASVQVAGGSVPSATAPEPASL